ncbi:MAG: hypothetical protein MJA31_09520 [Clostridia bacterium]|nr:hypothetical protein [Clostridia bacterium]
MELNLWGGVLNMQDYVLKPSHEIVILISGPLVNLLNALAFNFLYQYFSHPLIKEIVFVNTVLGTFNLMPISPLDGGKIIRLYLSYFIGYGKAIKISLIFSKIFSIMLFLMGVYLLQYDILYITMCCVAINIFISSQRESHFVLYKIIRFMEQPDHQASSKIVVYKSNKKVKHAVDTYNPSKKRLFTVVNEKGKYKGQLSETDILKGIFEHGIYADFTKLLEIKRASKEFGDKYTK